MDNKSKPTERKTAGKTSIPDKPRTPYKNKYASLIPAYREVQIAKHTTFRGMKRYTNAVTKPNHDRSKLETFRYLRILIHECRKNPNKIDRLREQLHEVEYADCKSPALQEEIKRLKSPESGLPQLYDTGENIFPSDICDDAKRIFERWCSENPDPSLMKGIVTKYVEHEGRSRFKYRKLDPMYKKRVAANRRGHNSLINGDCWPHQLCAMRDGAHGENEAGVYGVDKEGAYSVVLGGGNHADLDHGNTIEYCGNPTNFEGTVAPGTKRLQESLDNGLPVRVLRSASAKNSGPYRPRVGIRYDGLYTVVDVEVLPSSGIKRFKMQRVEGQPPIRCSGVEARPTAQGIKAFHDLR